MSTDPQSLIGTAIESYMLVRVLGHGGAGVVFLGHHPDGAQAAIKLLLPAIRTTPLELEGLGQRFLREAHVLAQLRHPHILPVLAYGQDPRLEHVYMIMPYLPGGTLADRLETGALTFEETKRYIRELASALDYAHAQGIIHRDIKPSNMLLNEVGQAVLADFGIAKVVDTVGVTLTATGEVLGTPAYMALEQIRGDNRAISAQTDIYGLGALAYHALTGQKPYGGATPQAVILAIAHSDPTPARQVRSDLPLPAEATLQKAMAREPSQRFLSAGSFAAALSLALDGQWPEGVAAPENPSLTQPAFPSPTLADQEPATESQQDAAYLASTYHSSPYSLSPTSHRAASGTPWTSPSSNPDATIRQEARPRSMFGWGSGVAILLLVAAVVAATAFGAGYAALHGSIFPSSQQSQHSNTTPAPTNGGDSSTSPGGRTTSVASPTPMAAGTAVPPNSYVAHLPGPCDTGAAQWSNNSLGKFTYTCETDGMHVAIDDRAGFVNGPEYSLVGGIGSTPSSYALSIHAADFSGTVCVGFVFGYNEGELCNSGFWDVFDYSSGTVAPSSDFTLTATCKPGEVALYDNGALLVRQPLPKSTCTHQISFYVHDDTSHYVAEQISCVVSTFVFTPLS